MSTEQAQSFDQAVDPMADQVAAPAAAEEEAAKPKK